jgi:drug/metabolite transporter (DMT)-like permease
MNKPNITSPPRLLIILAFATVYLVWGSTYYFILLALKDIPPMLLGAIRFLIAGLLMLAWCVTRGEKIFDTRQMKSAAVTGFLLLFMGNGAVIWSEQYLPSSLVAVLISAAPIWFVVLDKPNWKENLTNRETITGLIIGFSGVILLFAEQISNTFSSATSTTGLKIVALILILIGNISWSWGSLYSKKTSEGASLSVIAGWQMFAAGLVFLIGAFVTGEHTAFVLQQVTTTTWLSLLYLISMGSLAAYSAYVWLLQVRPATQVSTYAYVNPVVAVLLGVFLAGEKMSVLQIAGLVIILISVLLINLNKYRKEKRSNRVEELAAA